MSLSSSATPLLAGAHPMRPRQDTSAAAAGATGGGGSYTPVFIVLGVIAALLVISCIVGQVCTKKHLRPRPRRDRVAYYDDDMEGGFAHGHGGPAAIAKMEAAAPSATSVEVSAHQTAA
ncbi:hypothetical protein E2562_030971 [Oryza meyeriana var. granulata]|uniref:Uncharacterized protein n=1 Tax=Oryza meyeriana var. granulata TaxID=110450 RepID=A0A6G1ERA7_9ORYZ|nr:hypothetical protein E2562_030971 [Oryza meyeriana var. granulata]